MRSHQTYQKALKTNKLTKEEAVAFFDDLYKETDLYVRNNWKFYVNKGMWPIKAREKNKAQRDPVFVVNHCTGAKNGKHEPAMHRFFQAEQASAHILITISGNLIYLVPLTDLAYHATRRSGVIPGALATQLKVNDGKFLNEPSVEVVGSGNEKLFTSEALKSSIVVQRIMKAYFNESIKMIKSHRFFSPNDRKNDPGFTYLLPLIEHAIFNDIDLSSDDYWFSQYEKDPIKFMNQSIDILNKFNLQSKDEWQIERNKNKGKIDKTWLL